MSDFYENHGQRMIDILAQIDAAGGLQQWIDLRAAERGLSVGSPEPIEGGGGGGRSVKVMISSLAADPKELRILKNLLHIRRGEFASARLDMPQLVDAAMVAASTMDLGDALMAIEVHCVLVPRAYRAYGAVDASRVN